MAWHDPRVTSIPGSQTSRSRASSLGRAIFLVGAIELALIVAFLGVGALMDASGLRPTISASFVIDIVAVALILGVIAVTRSWSRWGFRRPVRGWIRPAVPLILVVVLFWASTGGLSAPSPWRWSYYVVLALAIAVFEETIFRGFMLRLLAPHGVGRAVWLSSLLFAISHGLNLFAGQNLLDTVQQIVFALLFGAALGWLAVLTGSLWIGIAVHALTDFPQFVAIREAGTVVDMSVLALLVVALILLSRAAKRRLVAPVPAA